MYKRIEPGLYVVEFPEFPENYSHDYNAIFIPPVPFRLTEVTSAKPWTITCVFVGNELCAAWGRPPRRATPGTAIRVCLDKEANAEGPIRVVFRGIEG